LLVGLLPRFFRSPAACPARQTERSSAYLLVPSAYQWLARLTGRSARRLTCSFLPLITGLPTSPDGALFGLLARSFRSSVACPARGTDRSSAYFLIPSTHQWLTQLARQSARRLTCLFLPLISGSPGSPDGALVGLLARSFHSSVACPARRTERSSAYFLVASARQWLAQLAARIAHRLTSLFLPLISGLPGSLDGALVGLLARFFPSSVACPARRTDRSSAYFLVPSAHQWLALLAGRITHRLTSSFLPLISCLPDGSSGGSLVSLLPLFFRSSAARTTVPRTDHSSAYFLVPSARQWLAPLAGRITHRLTSSFLPLVRGLPRSPDGSLIDLLPHSFRSSVACPARRMDHSPTYFLVPSARQWLAGLAGGIAHRLTSSFLLLVRGLPGSPDGSLIGLLPRFFRSSVACPAHGTDHSSAYFLVPSAHQWLARLVGRSAHRLTSSFLPLVSGLPRSPDGSLIDLLPCSFRSSVACPARRMDHSPTYFLVPSARQWLAGLAGGIAHRLTSSFLPLVRGLPGSPDGSLIGLLPRIFRSSVACPARRMDHSLAYFLVSSAHQWLARLTGQITRRLTSSFLPLISGLPGSLDGALIGLLPRFFRSSVACSAHGTDRSSAYFLVPSAHQWLARLAGRSAHWLTSSFLLLVSGFPSSPDGSLIGLLPRSFRSSVICTARQTERSSAYFLISSTCQWLAQLAGRIAHRLTSSFLPLISGLHGSPDGALVSLLACFFRWSLACPARRTDRSSAYFLVSSACQWLAQLARRITHWLTSSFLLLISCLPDGSSGGSLVGLLPRFFRSSAARPTVPRTDRLSAYFLIPSAHQWLARLAGQIAHRLTSSFLPLVSGLPRSPDGSLVDLLPPSFHSSVACPARRTDRSSPYFLVSSARRWLAGRIAHRLTSSFLPPISCLPDGSSGGSLVGLLPRFFRSSVARLTVPRTDRSSAYILDFSGRQWLAGRIARRLTSSSFPHQWLARLAERSAHRLTSSFLPLVSGLPGSPDGSLIDLLPRSFCSSVACPARRMDHSSTYFLIPSARQWLDRRFLGRIARRLTSSFLPLVSRSPDGSLVGLLVPSARQWLARLPGRIAHQLTSSFLPLVSGLPDGSSDGSLIGLLPRSFRPSVACLAHRTERSLAYFLVPSACQSLARRLAGRIAHRLTSLFLTLLSRLPDGLHVGLHPRSFRSSMACLTACRVDRSSASFLVPSACQWLARLAGQIAH